MNEITNSILHTLLNRHEQPQRRTVVRVRLERNRHAAYFDERDVASRRETNEELRELAGRGLLRLRWRAWEESNWIEAVDLAPESAGEPWTPAACAFSHTCAPLSRRT